MQAAIDSAKRRFDIDISAEIKRIKKDMDIMPVKKNGEVIKEGNLYPVFWLAIKRNFNKELINKDLHCPMNYLYNIKFQKHRRKDEVIPIEDFLVYHPLDENKKICRSVEELIIKYSLKLNEYNSSGFMDNDHYLLLRSDFEDMVNTIRGMNLSSKYLGLFSWLINRAFRTPTSHVAYADVTKIKSTLHKNKSLLLKVLYEVNKDNLMKCFTSE